LDGGHFFLLVLEGVARKPLPQAVYRYSTVAGATVVGFFMVFAILNDILRMFGI
jgi:membrane-associated protease RseP (regulator of RpoE activity)